MIARGKKAGERTDLKHPPSIHPASVLSTNVAELQRLTQALQIHQAELEIQNQALRSAQEELETSRDRYVSLYDFAPVGYVTVDQYGNIKEANLALAVMLGIERTKLTGRQFANFAPPRQRHNLRHFLRSDNGRSGRCVCETLLRRPDGKTIVAELIMECTSSAPVSAQHRIAVNDITEKAEVQRALRESRAILQTALQAAHMVAWSWNLANNRVTQSSSLGDIFGEETPEGYMVHGAMVKDIHPDDVGAYRKTVLDSITRGADYVVQFRIQPHWSKTTFWVEEHGRITSNAEGKAESVQGLVFDITARKVAEQGIRTNYERLEALIKDSSKPTTILNAEGKIECISRSGALILGYGPEELAGRDVQTLIHADDLLLATAQYKSIRETGGPASALMRARDKSGKLCWIDVEVSTILSHSFSYGYMATFRKVVLDVRDHHKFERQEGEAPLSTG